MLDDTGEEIDKELLDTFLDESEEVLSDLKLYVWDFRKPTDNFLFEEFGQKVDRIMGAAYTLSLKDVGDLARFGKEIGYKSSQINDVDKLLAIHSLLCQLQKTLEKIISGFRKGIRPDKSEVAPLLIRLDAANKQLGDLRASVKS